VAQIRPNYLLNLTEFDSWLDQTSNNIDKEHSTGYISTVRKHIEDVNISKRIFPSVSKKAWLDCLLQLLKVSVINRITPDVFKAMPVPYSNNNAKFPDVKADPLVSNIYSIGERVLLAWLNYCYAHFRNQIWTQVNESGRIGSPPRWIVNFDIDLTDSLALAACIGAYCPWMVESHMKRMYLIANTAEKCFHNALILIDCCRKIGLDYDINSLDITDPNPIAMILFCAFLFQKLPSYISTTKIEFTSPLHQVLNKKVISIY
jgi:hypothetical protein